ncbi:hypothetical protein ILYODFUR_000912 [Ilyodon furcidens]|uniref:Uncharacterized protein n=1 Tax=Ilyodon furcidens TaxID=33524 RepID=A0ABV0SWC6_9TELE
MVRKERKSPMSTGCVCKTGLLMSEVIGEWTDQLEMIKGNSSRNNHFLQPRYAECHLWTHNRSDLEADWLQQQKTSLGATSASQEQKTLTTIKQRHKLEKQIIAKMVPDAMSLNFSCKFRCQNLT